LPQYNYHILTSIVGGKLPIELHKSDIRLSDMYMSISRLAWLNTNTNLSSLKAELAIYVLIFYILILGASTNQLQVEFRLA